MYKKIIVLCLLSFPLLFISCKNRTEKQQPQKQTKIDKLLANYAEVKLKTDLSGLTENQKSMLPLLFEAAKIIDELYWIQTCGNKEKFLNSIDNEKVRKYFYINYGPWDRLNGMQPFIDGVGAKPDGANFYPADMTYQEFDDFDDLKKYDSYTLLRRNEVGGLKTVPYHEAYRISW